MVGKVSDKVERSPTTASSLYLRACYVDNNREGSDLYILHNLFLFHQLKAVDCTAWIELLSVS